jgi:hypothetical protein
MNLSYDWLFHFEDCCLYLGHDHKPKLALKGTIFDDIITIQKQSQPTPAKIKTQDYCKYFNYGVNAGLDISSCKGATWEWQVNTVILEKRHKWEIFDHTLYNKYNLKKKIV